MRLAVSLIALAALAACSKAPQDNTAKRAEPGPAPASVDYPMLASKPVDVSTAAKVMKERHDGMEAIGKASKSIKRALDTTPANMAAIRAAANILTANAPKVAGWFPPGTGTSVGKTQAKDSIWANPQDFAKKANDFNQAAKAFSVAAADGDAGQVKTAYGNLGKTCKACHDDYKSKDN